MPYLVMGLATGTGAPTPNTNLLIHSDTTNGSTTFIDSSPGALALTANGLVEHSTAQAKFGASSIYFPSTSPYGSITTEENNGFAVGTGDWTMDLWVYRTGNFNTGGLFSCLGYTASPSGNTDGPAILTSDSFPDRVYCYVGGNSNFDGGWLLGTIPLNTWTHIAFVRASNVIYTFLNGVATNHGANSRNCTVRYASVGARYYDGQLPQTAGVYIDEVRFSKVAEWTGNFTPPTAPYV